MSNLIDGTDLAEYLELDSSYAPKYEDAAAAASVWAATYCTIPVDTTALVLGVKMLGARLAKRSATPEGIGGITDGGVFYVSKSDPDAVMLLSAYINWAGQIG